MRTAIAASLSAAVLLFAAPAQAEVAHVVKPGETLWSIAAANNLYTNALAAYNGLSPEAQVVLGSTIKVPTVAEALVVVNNQAASGQPAAQQQSAPQGAPPLGAYKVRVGDTLTGIAERAGVPREAIAAANGLDPDGHVLAGTVIKLPTGSTQQVQNTAPAPAPSTTRVADVPPYATPGFTNSGEISQVATQHGLAPSLASAIAWQESGFNNGLVSSANARGVMQILPGTWSWIQDNLASSPLDPHSPRENVHAGVMYLRQLLKDTGGDERLAIASYYQGWGSVRDRGLLPETEEYVKSVMANRARFGG